MLRRHAARSFKFVLDVMGVLPLDWILLDTIPGTGNDDLHQYLSWVKLLQLVGAGLGGWVGGRAHATPKRVPTPTA